MRYPYETFRLLTVGWDVALAWAIIEHEKREPKGMIPVAQLKNQLAIRHIDESIFDTVDLSVPILLGTMRPHLGEGFLLDGAHRVAKALATGVEALPYHHFSLDETIWLEEESHLTEYNGCWHTHACGAEVWLETQHYDNPTNGLHETRQIFTQHVLTSYTEQSPTNPIPGTKKFLISVTFCLQCDKALVLAGRFAREEQTVTPKP